MSHTSVAARTAAKWWADKLRGGSPLDMGADSPQSEFAEILGQIHQRDLLDSMPAEAINSFEEKLAKPST